MFTQKISMGCTKEQCEKYLKEELLKMGYREDSISGWHNRDNECFTNSFGGSIGYMGNINYASKNLYECVYLGKFNAPLFLALAAMTDKEMGNYGEYWRPISQNYYKINDWWKQNNGRGANDVWRKATVSEIMAKFGEQQPSIEERLEKVERFIAELPCEKVSEPKYKEPIVGEMAIFWNKRKAYAIVAILSAIVNDDFLDNDDNHHDHAILYESPEQYKEFINA